MMAPTKTLRSSAHTRNPAILPMTPAERTGRANGFPTVAASDRLRGRTGVCEFTDSRLYPDVRFRPFGRPQPGDVKNRNGSSPSVELYESNSGCQTFT